MIYLKCWLNKIEMLQHFITILPFCRIYIIMENYSVFYDDIHLEFFWLLCAVQCSAVSEVKLVKYILCSLHCVSSVFVNN